MLSNLSTLQPTPALSSTASTQPTRYFAGDDEFMGFLRDLQGSNPTSTAGTHIRTFEQGDVVCTQDELMHNMYILLEGRLNMVCESARGTRLVISTLEPGTVFGEGALPVPNQSNPVVEAAEGGKVVRVPADEAHNMVVQHPILGWALLQSYGQRLLQVEQNLEDVAYKTLPERLASLLLDFSNHENGMIDGVSHQTLADYLGTYRETVSAILRDFKAEGMVELGYRRIAVLDQEGLKDVAGIWEW